MTEPSAAWASPVLGELGLDTECRAAARSAVLRRRVPVDTAIRVGAAVADYAARQPHRVAVAHGTESVTYTQLAARVDRLAWLLAAHSVRVGDVVAVCAPRSADLLAAFVALESLGAVYLPLDGSWPPERSRHVLAESGAVAVLAPEGAEVAGAHVPVLPLTGMSDAQAPPRPAAAADDEPRYVIFTSGTTGMPKGAVVEHRGMINHLLAKIADLGLTGDDRVAFTAPISFDISIWQMLGPLLVGATVVVVDETTAAFPRRMMRALVDQDVTVAEVVPTIAAALAHEYARGRGGSALRWLISTGEELRASLAGELLAVLPQVALMNAYGPTECSDDVTHYRVTLADTTALRIPIGTPVANCDLYLLVDDGGHWRAARPGEAAELFVGGVSVGRGYLGRPDLTQCAFFRDELDPTSPTGRLYRTGDVVRLDRGVLTYLGRVDRQVKVGGVRIELDEIEAVVSRHPDVRECAVDVVEDTGRLGAWLVARDGAAPTVQDLLRHAREWLPAASVPASWHVVDRLPRTANGKVDRRALRTAHRQD